MSKPVFRSKQAQTAGWGNTPSADVNLYRPERYKELFNLIQHSKECIARGLGRSYGDPALNKGATILTERLDKILSFNEKTGVMRAQAGVSVAELLTLYLHKGWVPPAMPGTKHVSLGGCLAADVHGRDHHKGSFGNHVKSLTLMTAKGEVLTCSVKENEDLFKATIGGMGLTGVILDMTFTMAPIPSTELDVTCLPFKSIEEGLALMKEHSGKSYFVGSWVDALSKKGRGWVQFSKPVEKSQVRPYNPTKEIGLIGKLYNVFSPLVPSFMLNSLTMRLANEVIFKSVGKGWQKRIDIIKLLFPLDRLPAWNRLYGKSGFYQFQCVVPKENAVEVLSEIVIASQLVGSYFSTMKPFGKVDAKGLLSFSMPEGVTLALDVPNRAGAEACLRQLSAAVVEAGGRVYLAKDAVILPRQCRQMYPEIEKFMEIKEKFDPKTKFSSLQYQRLMKKRGGK